jgi:hypothetical protein
MRTIKSIFFRGVGYRSVVEYVVACPRSWLQLVSTKTYLFPDCSRHSILCVCLWQLSLCNPDWPGTLDPPVSASWVLGLELCTATPSHSTNFWGSSCSQTLTVSLLSRGESVLTFFSFSLLGVYHWQSHSPQEIWRIPDFFWMNYLHLFKLHKALRHAAR